MNKIYKKFLWAISSPSREDIEKRNERKVLSKLDLSKIISVDFPDNQYYSGVFDKKQVVLHHTVSGQGVNGDISWWRQTAARIGTAIIIGWDGKIYQCFSSKYWGYHLGLKTNNNKKLNQTSIGIEIDSWGGLVKDKNGLWYPSKWDSNLKRNVPNTRIKSIPVENVQIFEKGFRGYYGFEKYTDAQIEAVRKLLVFFHEKYNIPLEYNEDMWDVSENALNGKSGIWTHVSFRSDKSDCYPDERLIKMLKELSNN